MFWDTEILCDEIELRSLRFCEYELKVADKVIGLSFPQLLELRKNINLLTNPERLEEMINHENFALVFIADRQHLVYLEIPQLLYLRNEIFSFFNHSYPVLV
jgi:hypothetical protein